MSRFPTFWWMVLGALSGLTVSLSAATVSLSPVADTFLSEFNPTHNVGGHTNVAAGTVSNGTRTRALLRFDVAGSVPAGAIITSGSLQITATRVNASGGVNSTFQLRRVLLPWTEGTRTASLGAPGNAGETTWRHRILPDTPWGSLGGALGTDFATTVSSTALVAGIASVGFPSSADMIADIQHWLDSPALNFGWVLMTESEDRSETARRFASREDAASAPVLTLEYSLATPSLRFTGIRLAGNQVVMSWADGRPTYQLQTRPGLGQPWTNVGEPSANLTATVPAGGAQAFYRVVQDYTARYQVVFQATWSAATHPAEFPIGSAHWSGLVGGVHDQQVHFWREGETASEGIRMMAELGSQPRLLSEVNAAMANGTAHFSLSGGGVNPAPGSRVLVFPQLMRRDYPRVTLCSMIAPSPDWFVGVDSLSLIEDGAWVATKTVALSGFDAGTDSGASYGSADVVTTPRGVVTRFTGFPALVNGVLVSFGEFTFSRLD